MSAYDAAVNAAPAPISAAALFFIAIILYIPDYMSYFRTALWKIFFPFLIFTPALRSSAFTVKS